MLRDALSFAIGVCIGIFGMAALYNAELRSMREEVKYQRMRYEDLFNRTVGKQ